MSEEISKYEKEMQEYFEQIRQLCSKGFSDFVVIGIDVTGESAQIYHVGEISENSISNRDRLVRMVGELENLKFNLQIGGVVMIDEDDGEDTEEDNN